MLADVADALSGARRREAGEFAALLEGGRVPAGNDLAGLVSLARALAPVERSPSPDFRSSLRARLVTEAADRVPAVPAQRTPRPARPARTRLRYAVAGLAVASLVTGVGAAAASTHALPGDALYGLKLRIEAVQLSLADTDLERGRELLEQAESRLGEVERLAASGTADEPGTRREIGRTLTEMEQATTAGAAALTRSYSDTGDPEPMLLLDRFVAQQQERLADLLRLLSPALRARLLAAADTLQEIGGQAGAVLTALSLGTAQVPTGSPGSGTGTGAATGRIGTGPVAGVVGGGTGPLPGASAGASTGTGGLGVGADTSTGTGGVGISASPLAPLPLPSSLPQPTFAPSPPAVPLPPAPVTPPVVPLSPAPVTPSVVPVPVVTPPCVVVPPLTSC